MVNGDSCTLIESRNNNFVIALEEGGVVQCSVADVIRPSACHFSHVLSGNTHITHHTTRPLPSLHRMKTDTHTMTRR